MGDTENVMFASCQNKDAAFAWLTYLAAGKGQETWCKGNGQCAVAASVKAMDEFQSNPFMKVSIEGAPYAGILPILDTTTEWISSVWPSTVQQALLGELRAGMHDILQTELYK